MGEVWAEMRQVEAGEPVAVDPAGVVTMAVVVAVVVAVVMAVVSAIPSAVAVTATAGLAAVAPVRSFSALRRLDLRFQPIDHSRQSG